MNSEDEDWVPIGEERPCPFFSAYSSICLDLVSLIEELTVDDRAVVVENIILFTLGLLILLGFVILTAKRTD